MSPPGSITAWNAQLKAGKDAVLDKLHARYWTWLVDLARKRLKGTPARAADEEDVAQEALVGFYTTCKAGRVPWLVTRADLLALLTQIVTRKALNQIKYEVGVQKRGQGQVVAASALAVAECADDGPTPADQALLNDCYEHYVDGLPPELRQYAALYLAGHTHREIAVRMNRSEPTVGRKLALVLEMWRERAAGSLDGA